MSELFTTDWTMGNLSTIGTVKNVMALIAVVIISFIGFAIVVSSIAKNAVAGLYATNPKLWDKVKAAKSGGKDFKSASGIMNTILSLLPDVKGFTDFDDEGTHIDPKGYFMKAIPAMVISVFVGIFIFYGYPTRVAEKIGSVGTGVVDVFLTNVNPEALVNTLFTKFTKPEFATENTTDDKLKAVNIITNKVWNAYVGSLKDMTKEKRVSVGYEIEDWVLGTSDDYAEYTNTDKYKMNCEVHIFPQGAKGLEYIHNKLDEATGIYTVAYSASMNSWSSGSTLVTDDMDIAYYLTFTPVASKEDTKSINTTMTVSALVIGTNSAKVTIGGNSVGNPCYVSVTGTAGGTAGDSTVSITVNSNVLTVKTFTGKLQGNISEITGISGLYYITPTGKHPIKTIRFKNNTKNVTFNGAGLTWYLGQDPDTSVSDSSDEESTRTETDSDSDLSGF